jgi:acyl carrier protein
MTDISADIAVFLKDSPSWADRDVHIDSSTELLQHGGLDSLGVLELVTYLEQTYNVEILDEEVVPENFGRLGDVADLVRCKLATG